MFATLKKLEIAFENVEVLSKNNSKQYDEVDFLELFLSAKQIEGCSKNTIFYYKYLYE